jgi:hypothetical protein
MDPLSTDDVLRGLGLALVLAITPSPAGSS